MRILHLDLDTLRPDHLGCYGYHRNTSPNIDSVAQEGTIFTNYYVSDAPCLPSRAALFSGRFGIHNGAVGHGGTTGDMIVQGKDRQFRSLIGTESMPCMLRQAGLHTCTISPFGERHASFWFYSGFKEVHNTGKGGGESAEEISPVVMDWLDTNGSSDDWYLHVNYWDPHTPYRAPTGYGNPFKDEPLPAWMTNDVVEDMQNAVGPHSAHEYGMYTDKENDELPRNPGSALTMDGFRKAVDGYDCGIGYMDEHIGNILKKLKDLGVYEDMAIIISSDHGENMGELGIWGEHATADAITPRIPMIVRWPGCKPNVDDGLHYNLDLAPTLADMFSLSPMPSWDGASYADTLKNQADTGRDQLILSQCAHVCQRSVRFDDYIYMRTYHDGFHLFDQELLFDVVNDPHEQHNLAEEKPELLGVGARKLMEWHDDMMQSHSSAIDPLWQTIRDGGPFHAKGHLKEYCKRLEATGRGWAVPELKKRHPQEFE